MRRYCSCTSTPWQPHVCSVPFVALKRVFGHKRPLKEKACHVSVTHRKFIYHYSIPIDLRLWNIKHKSERKFQASRRWNVKNPFIYLIGSYCFPPCDLWHLRWWRPCHGTACATAAGSSAHYGLETDHAAPGGLGRGCETLCWHKWRSLSGNIIQQNYKHRRIFRRMFNHFIWIQVCVCGLCISDK